MGFLHAPDYGFEYSDEEPEEEDVDIENQYYNSKGWCHRQGTSYAAIADYIAVWTVPASTAMHRSEVLCTAEPVWQLLIGFHCCTGMLEGDDLREALEGFQQVVEMEQDKGEW